MIDSALGQGRPLCIGFLQPHKGFDRAMRAFTRLPDREARLFVVGSARLPRAEILAHIQELKSLAAGDSRIRLIERFLSDAEFDTWIAAADAVVVPYRGDLVLRGWSPAPSFSAQARGRRRRSEALAGQPRCATDVVVEPRGTISPTRWSDYWDEPPARRDSLQLGRGRRG